MSLTALPRLPLLLIGATLWAACVFGALQLHHTPDWIGCGICGPWGCAARPEAIVGYHLFLVTLLAPAAVLVGRVAPAGWARWWGGSLLAVGVIGALAIAGAAAVQWQEPGADGLRPYTLQRAGFVLLTTTDAVVLPLALSGAASLIVNGLARRPRRAPRDRPAQSAAAAGGSPGTP